MLRNKMGALRVTLVDGVTCEPVSIMTSSDSVLHTLNLSRNFCLASLVASPP